MRLLSIAFFTLFYTSVNCQIDSILLADKYLPKFYKDTGTYLQSGIFIDDKGKEKTLNDFKGKILYVDMWSTSCAACITKFPHQEQLFKRVKALQLDSSIIFININTEDTKSKWKKRLAEISSNRDKSLQQ